MNRRRNLLIKNQAIRCGRFANGDDLSPTECGGHGHTTIPAAFAGPDAGRSPRSASSNASTVIDPVTASDVRLAQDNETNSFIFGFESPAQIVGRQIAYALDGLPANWFDLYLRGIQAVTPEQVRQVVERYLHSDRLITVVVGNPAAFDRPLSTLGPVTTLRLEEIRR